MIFRKTGGAEGNRTPDLVIANDALSQLSYSPEPGNAGPSLASGNGPVWEAASYGFAGPGVNCFAGSGSWLWR